MPGKTPISNADTYQDIGAFWDEHDATEFGEQAEVEFDVHIEFQRRYYPLDNRLSSKVREIAEKRGISQETLINLWIQEKINQTLSIEETTKL
jgi:putative aminopeptidase FrvX